LEKVGEDEGNGKFIPAFATKACEGNGGIAPLISLGTRWR